MAGARHRHGLTLLELLAALAVATLLLAALGGALSGSLAAFDEARERTDQASRARFAMDRLAGAVRGTSRLLLPLVENPATPQLESVRSVLAVALDPSVDLDADGFADADNDRDGRVDEDPGADLNNDGKAGILGIDDDNDGKIDESSKEDDDEDEDDGRGKDEDRWNDSDEDGDGSVDEDTNNDLNQDEKSGISGIDDDGDGSVDESSKEDDDEDEDQTGRTNEDWIDSVVYFLQGTNLVERYPTPHATSGLAYTERVIVDGVTQFRVERLAAVGSQRAQVVDLTLTVTAASGRTLTLRTAARVGGAR